MFEFMTGKTPFCKSHKETSYAIYLRVLKGKISFPGHFEKDAKDLMKQLTNADVAKRMKDVDSIKNHPWFAQVQWDRVLKRGKARRNEWLVFTRLLTTQNSPNIFSLQKWFPHTYLGSRRRATATTLNNTATLTPPRGTQKRLTIVYFTGSNHWLVVSL